MQHLVSRSNDVLSLLIVGRLIRDIQQNGGVKNAALVRQFGQEVRRRRSELGVSQEELAGISGLHRTYLSGIECGERNPTIDIVFVLARALQCQPADLMPKVAVADAAL